LSRARGTGFERFVGRAHELELIRSLAAGAAGGDPSCIVVTGEAGIGKSRLIHEALQSGGVHVIVSGAIPLTGHSIAYGPWLKVWQRLRDVDPLRDLAGRPAEVTGQRIESERARVLDWCFDAVAEAAARKPLAIVLEDLQWADEASLALLAFIARRIETERLILIATARVHRTATPALALLVAELAGHDGVHEIRLDALGLTEVAQLNAAAGSDDQARAEMIFHRSGGNPSFAVELVSTGTVPERLRDLVLSRLEAMPDDVLDVVRALAVLGRPASDALLGSVTARAGKAEAASETFGRAVGLNLISLEREEPARRYTFRHGVTAEVVLDDMPPRDRAGWHLAVADALRAAAVNDRVGVAELAEHLYRANRPKRALRAAYAAAREAMALVAPHQAQLHVLRVLELWPLVAKPERACGATREDVLYLAAGAARWLGDMESALRLVREALAASAAPEVRARLLERQGRCLYESGDSSGAALTYQEAADLLTDAEPTVLRLQVQAALASLLMLRGEHTAATVAAHAVAAQAAVVGAARQEAYALTTAGISGAELGETERCIVDLQRAQRLARDADDIEGQMRAETALCVALDRLGRLADAVEPAERAYSLTKRYQLFGNLGLITAANLLDLLRMTGRWDEADDIAETVPLAGTFTQHRCYFRVVRAQFYLARGRFEEVDRDLADAVTALDAEQPDVAVPFWNTSSELALWRGDTAAAARHLEKSLTLAHRAPLSQLAAWTMALGWRVATQARCGPEWVSSLDTLNRLVGDRAELGLHGMAWSAVAHGEKARYQDRPDPAPWDEAASRWRQLGRRYDEAYALYRLSESYLGVGDRPPAIAAAGRALDLTRELGAEPLGRELHGFTRRARISTASAVRARDAAEREGLTPREIEVLGLISEGNSNRDIAGALYISARTVGVHVSNILAKLQAKSRTEAASIGRRRGLI
jgi:DNA-binding CsgD family transcriptional regulator/tetratricopeptide (TPR) repeat protein